MSTTTKPRGFQLGKFYKRSLYLSFVALFASGVMWLIAYYLLAETTDYGVIPSQYEMLSLQVHGLAAPLFLLVMGAIFPLHIARAYKSGINLFTGMTLLVAFGVLSASGYLLYYCGDESLRNLASIAHSSLGLLAAPILVFHIFRGRKLMREVGESGTAGMPKEAP